MRLSQRAGLLDHLETGFPLEHESQDLAERGVILDEQEPDPLLLRVILYGSRPPLSGLCQGIMPSCAFVAITGARRSLLQVRTPRKSVAGPDVIVRRATLPGQARHGNLKPHPRPATERALHLQVAADAQEPARPLYKTPAFLEGSEASWRCPPLSVKKKVAPSPTAPSAHTLPP